MDKDTDITKGQTDLIAQLEDYLVRFPAEEATVERVIDFVRREPGCFSRYTSEGHITGSAWVVNQDGTRTLLTHHRKLNKWLQLGGHADGNPNVLEVAIDEAREESGIREIEPVMLEIFDVDVHTIPARMVDPEHLHFDVRYALRAAHMQHTVSAESHDLAWVEIHALAQYTTEYSMLRMANKWNTYNKRFQ